MYDLCLRCNRLYDAETYPLCEDCKETIKKNSSLNKISI